MRREGKTIQMAHSEAVSKNDVILKDGFAMIALNDGEKDELVAYGVSGTFDFSGLQNHTLKVGDKAYYNATKKSVSQTAGDVFIGRVVFIEKDIVEVKINTGV